MTDIIIKLKLLQTIKNPWNNYLIIKPDPPARLFITAVVIDSVRSDSPLESPPELITTAVINKRAGGSGLIMGRKAFQRPFNEGVELLQSVQSVYLEKKITIA